MALENDIARLEKLKKESEQIKARTTELEARIKLKKRKERTRRLIQVGAVIDSVGVNTESFAILFKNVFLNSKDIKPLFEKFMLENSKPVSPGDTNLENKKE
jgi:hypothetical protein